MSRPRGSFTTTEEEWPETVHLLTEKMKKTNFPHQVAASRSLDDMIGKVMDNLAIKNKISSWISRCSETKYAKSGSTASRLRDKGNEKFGAHDNVGALKLYSESVICAPEVGPELSLAFGNRSAALYHLGQYQAASDDITLALGYKFPHKTEYKLLQRKAQCLIRLGQYEPALEQLSRCEISLRQSNITEEKRREAVGRDIAAIRREAQNLLDENCKSSKKLSNILHLPEHKTSHVCDENHDGYKGNSELPGASYKLILNTSSDSIKGRFVTTKEDIKVGEVLFREAPHSCVLLPEYYSSNCNSCLIKLVAPIACKRCTQPRYCSSSCRDSAWTKHHQFECGHLDLLHSVGIGHLAVRTLLTAGRDHLLEIARQVKSGNYHPVAADPYSMVFNLQHHLQRLPVEEVFQYSVTAALLTTVLEKHTSFLSPERAVPGVPGRLKQVQPGQEVSETTVNYIGSLLLRHISQLVGNAHAVTELEEREGEVEQVRLASGIYPSASMMNHSCIPAIINSFSGPVLEVRAVRELSAGGEVTNCYGPHYRRHEYSRRQEMLVGQYRFRCSCLACIDPKERIFFDQFTATKCSKCSGPVLKNNCSLCNHPRHPGLTSIWQDLFKSALRQPENVSSLRNAEEKMSKVLFCHHEDLARVRDMLARALATGGDYQGAAQYLRMSLETVKVRYGESSIELANELLKLTDVLIAEANCVGDQIPKEIVECLKVARNIFNLQYGKQSSQYIEAEEKLCYYSGE